MDNDQNILVWLPVEDYYWGINLFQNDLNDLLLIPLQRQFPTKKDFRFLFAENGSLKIDGVIP